MYLFTYISPGRNEALWYNWEITIRHFGTLSQKTLNVFLNFDQSIPLLWASVSYVDMRAGGSNTDGPFWVEKANQDSEVISPLLPSIFFQATQGDIDNVNRCYIFELE